MFKYFYKSSAPNQIFVTINGYEILILKVKAAINGIIVTFYGF